MRKLTKVNELRTPCRLYNIVDYEQKAGNRKPIYETDPPKENEFKASIKSFGGTETVVNGKISYVDTIEVKCTYRPDIHINSRIELINTNEMYEVINKPENVDRRNVELVFKCEAVKK